MSTAASAGEGFVRTEEMVPTDQTALEKLIGGASERSPISSIWTGGRQERG